MTTAIQTESISLNMGNFRMDRVSCEIPLGKITAIVGPNGSGKSTMLKVVTQLLSPDEGRVQVLDRPLDTYPLKQFAQTVSMLPQSKEGLPALTVGELVSYGRTPHKKMFEQRWTDEDEKKISLALEMTGTHKHKDRLLHTLSGGERQKARIAMTLAQSANIIILDEPTTFLDIAHQLDVMEMLEDINNTFGTTIVMVLHDLQQAAAYSDYLIAMKSGKVHSSGSPQNILTTEFLKEIYDIDARVQFEDEYPLIIPITNKTRRKMKWSS